MVTDAADILTYLLQIYAQCEEAISESFVRFLHSLKQVHQLLQIKVAMLITAERLPDRLRKHLI